MDINCDLEKNEHVTFSYLAHDCQPMCTVQKRGKVSNIRRYSRPVPTGITFFYWEYVMQPERFIPMVQTIFQQFVLTGA